MHSAVLLRLCIFHFYLSVALARQTEGKSWIPGVHQTKSSPITSPSEASSCYKRELSIPIQALPPQNRPQLRLSGWATWAPLLQRPPPFNFSPVFPELVCIICCEVTRKKPHRAVTTLHHVTVAQPTACCLPGDFEAVGVEEFKFGR